MKWAAESDELKVSLASLWSIYTRCELSEARHTLDVEQDPDLTQRISTEYKIQQLFQ